MVFGDGEGMNLRTTQHINTMAAIKAYGIRERDVEKSKIIDGLQRVEAYAMARADDEEYTVFGIGGSLRARIDERIKRIKEETFGDWDEELCGLTGDLLLLMVKE